MVSHVTLEKRLIDRALLEVVPSVWGLGTGSNDFKDLSRLAAMAERQRGTEGSLR
jgi:hypothetical protein